MSRRTGGVLARTGLGEDRPQEGRFRVAVAGSTPADAQQILTRAKAFASAHTSGK